MRPLALIVPLAMASALAFPALAQAPRVIVTLGSELAEKVEDLGQRDVDRQMALLQTTVERELARSGTLDGAEVNLVVTELKPNRPTFQQAVDRPGLSVIDSRSIGGATIEGEVITADGERRPVRYSHYSTSIAEVYSYSTWFDAERAYDRLAGRLASGRLVSR
ncbi:MAG: hypothetical protein Q8S03_07970 [Brevundimonas sp.]|uniref:hypothetical protein n=1 Tax=Brevundimonas sp. TaxID=1871086 RepID=UPI002732386F|nr:hypothetical protein [Brevundimonas sp.]MDP3404610.1 hypothetical protein [Brevundimonas sp.]